MKIHLSFLTLHPLVCASSVLRGSLEREEQNNSNALETSSFREDKSLLIQRNTAVVCPSSVSAGYQINSEVLPCTTNADCSTFGGGLDLSCCIYPMCICGARDFSAYSGVQCLLNVDERIDDTTHSFPPITIIIPPQITVPARSPGTLSYCPSSESTRFQTLPGVTGCSGPADCEGITSVGLPTCCLYPMCICGLPDTNNEGDVSCAWTDPRTASVTPPTPPPTRTPTPIPATCPVQGSIKYQLQPNVQPCNTNKDCVNVLDGCCVHPFCICGKIPGPTQNSKCVPN